MHNSGAAVAEPAYFPLFFKVAEETYVLKVDLPRDEVPSINNSISWKALWGAQSDKFKVEPADTDANIRWTVDGIPSDFTSVTWVPYGSSYAVGSGTNPQLTIKYYNSAGTEYLDFLPPDSAWFGKKSVSVALGIANIENRPVWIYFNVLEVRNRQTDGKEIAAWYYYWKQGAVVLLNDFEYVHDLGPSTVASHSWAPLLGDTYKVAYGAAFGGAMKPIFDTTANTYTEEQYPDHQSKGIHGVAKLCAHEKWHGILRKEVRSTLLGGYGETDSDSDGLSDAKEMEIGTNPYAKDTCNLSSFSAGGTSYSDYAAYADQELYCRWKQAGNSGDQSKDWAFPGMQAYAKP